MSNYKIKPSRFNKFLVTTYDVDIHQEVNVCKPLTLPQATELVEHLDKRDKIEAVELAKKSWGRK